MRHPKLSMLGLITCLWALCNLSYGQALYTQQGSDPTWKYIMDNNLIPVGSNSTKGIKGSTINVKNNLVEVGPFKDRPIEQNINIHTLGNSVIGRNSFSKWTRWYQEDDNTQVFRLFDGEHNVRNTRANAARIEAFSKKKWDKGGWHEWVGTYTIVKPQGCAIFQVKNGGEDWSIQLQMSDAGDVVFQPRRGTRKVVYQKWVGKPFHVKIRDNGLTTEVYIDGNFIGKTDWARPSGGSAFRWGMYVGGKKLSAEALMFVTGATVDPAGNTGTGGGNGGGGTSNQSPSITITSPTNGQTISLGANVSVNINANDSDGIITEHKVYVNGTLVDTDGSNYTAHEITNVQEGTYTVKVTVKDNDGATSEDEVTFTVEGSSGGGSGGNDSQCAFEEKNGVVAFEAEDFASQEKTNLRQWYVIGDGSSTPGPDPDGSHASGASKGKYIEILKDTRVTHDDPLGRGESFSDEPGELCIVNYPVYFNTTGKYYVWVRAYSTGTEDNGVHVGIDGTWPASGARMQWCQGKNQWTWESKQRTSANHCGEAQQIFLNVTSPGLHTISFSLREDGFEMDKIVLSKTYTKPSGSGPAVVSTDCDNPSTGSVKVSGELKRWHKVTLTMDGPNTSETANPNPFTNYRCDVTFTHSSGASYVVPGYYAACDNPAEGCSSGNKWKAHFSPDRTGAWNYSISFKTGSNVAMNGGGSSAGFFDGSTGNFSISESDKSGRDFRAKDKGKLRYVGEHYLRFAGTGGNNSNGEYFFKAGADAPENTLAYNDFDATPNRGGRRKTWSPHQQDYSASEASSYTWKGGKGTELLGAVRYLSNTGVNAFSFLTLSLHGDDENVFPHLMKVNESTYNGYNDAQQWNNGVHHNRFDVSKLAQWERVFEYADAKGMFMHFKTLETENDNMMDNDNFGNERKIYYRELVARFGHHLGLNWNLSEESTMKDNVVKQTASYIKSIDPYDNHIVLHTYPNQKDQRYDPLLGNSSELTGASLQTSNSTYNEVKSDVKKWVNKSAQANKKWVVCLDEPGNAQIGIDNDDNGSNDKLVRNKVLWATLLSGGMGVEYYYGYQTGQTDLSAQNHRSRDQKYKEAAIALEFMRNYVGNNAINMSNADNVTSDNNDHVFAEAGKIYVVYRPNGGTTGINLPGNGWKVQWYNPRNGGALTSAANVGSNLVAPNNNDWVALITKGSTSNDPPVISFASPQNGASFLAPADLEVTVNASAGNAGGSISNVKLYLDGVLVRQENGSPYNWGLPSQNDNALKGLAVGSYELKAVATDNEGRTSESIITVTVTSDDVQTLEFSPIHDAYLQGATRFNSDELRVENGNRTTYLMFDLSAVTGTVVSAKLSLAVSSDPGDGNIDVNLGNGTNWTETNLTASNAPSKGSLAGQLNSTYLAGSTYEWDLTGLTGGGSRSLILSHTSGNDVSFSSKEGVTAPKLILVVERESEPKDCAGVPGGSAFLDACGVCSGGTTGRQPSEPTNWYRDADGDGFGDPNDVISECSQPVGYVANNNDQCTSDPNKSQPGDCGCGVPEGTCSENQSPEVVFTQPLNGDEYDEGVSLIANVQARDDGAIANVKLYINGTFVRQENISTYDWNHKGQDPALQNMAPGTYVFRAIATDDEGATGEASITITVKEEVVVEDDPILGDDCAVKNGTANFELNPDYMSGANNISWWFSGSSSSVISPASAPHTVEVTMSEYYKGGEVCVGLNLDVAPWYTSYCKPVGVCSQSEFKEPTAIEVNEYPNPMIDDEITVDVSEESGDILSISIVNESGEVKYSSTNFVSGNSIQLESLPAGTYHLKLVCENGVVYKKLLKL